MLKKILICLLIVLAAISCERKPLYLRGDAALKINVVVEADIDALWNDDWRDNLKYDWNEEKYGRIGYSMPEKCDVVVFNSGSIVKEAEVDVGKRSLIDIELDETYDILIYSKEKFWFETYYEGGKYYIDTPHEEGTKAVTYETVEQPGEVFACSKKNLYLPDDVSFYEEVFDDGKLIYVYNIDEKLNPASYIYIIQFIVVNDDGSDIIEAKDIQNFTVSGISIKKDLIENKPEYTENKRIEAFDIKPGQNIGNSIVFASRVTMLGILPDNPETSWSSSIDYSCLTSIKVDTHNYGTVNGTKDITEQLRKNPRGGIITVRILNSELKQGGESGSGFGVDLGEWGEHEYHI